MSKLIIAGSQTFNDYRFLSREVKRFIQESDIESVRIITGKAPGADTFGEMFAIRNGLPYDEFPADWKQYGKRAGPIRNEVMAKYATHCIVFWDGTSPGSANMIEHATNYGLILKVIKF